MSSEPPPAYTLTAEAPCQELTNRRSSTLDAHGIDDCIRSLSIGTPPTRESARGSSIRSIGSPVQGREANNSQDANGTRYSMSLSIFGLKIMLNTMTICSLLPNIHPRWCSRVQMCLSGGQSLHRASRSFSNHATSHGETHQTILV
jgi:hypothetical protein